MTKTPPKKTTKKATKKVAKKATRRAAATPASATTPAAGERKGRPPGSPNITEIVDVIPSRCRKCGCTERTPYVNAQELAHGGVTGDGRQYTHIVWRSTRCVGCNQGRRDRVFENRPEKK